MKPRHKRLAAIVAGVALLGAAVGLVLYAFQSNLVFFFSPTQVAAGEAPRDRAFRIGGLVQAGSLKRGPEALANHFVVTDTADSSALTSLETFKAFSSGVRARCEGMPVRLELSKIGSYRLLDE